jgi:hypothetical protein
MTGGDPSDRGDFCGVLSKAPATDAPAVFKERGFEVREGVPHIDIEEEYRRNNRRMGPVQHFC